MKNTYNDPAKRQHLGCFLNFVKQHCEFKAFSIDDARKLYGISSNSSVALMSAKIIEKTDGGYRWITGSVTDQVVDSFINALRAENGKCIKKVLHSLPVKQADDNTSTLLKSIVELLDAQNKLFSSFIASFGVDQNNEKSA